MKTIHKLLIVLLSVFSFGFAQAQCIGNLTSTGTDPSYNFFYNVGTGMYNWNFGDGTSSIAPQSVGHTYANNGLYTVIVQFTDSANFCSSSDTLLVSVLNAASSCNASFSITGTDPSFVFTPNNIPISPAGYYYFIWTFGDGSTATSTTMTGVSYTYSANGTYPVTCILYDSIYCSDTVSIPLTVTGGSASTCDASIGYIDSNGLVSFFPLSPISSATYFWSFGDGTTSTLQNPVHQYSLSPNTYTVCLTLTDTTNNCVDSTCTLININVGTSPCDASFTFTNSGAMYTFSPNYPMSGANYNWVTSNGLTSNFQIPTFTFNSPGAYTICLALSDSASACVDSSCVSITIAPPVNNTIFGTITMGNTPADYGVVFLIELDSTAGTLTAVDTTVIDSSGYYGFYSVPTGMYLVKAALSPASVNYTGYLPTYYSTTSGGELLWSNASFAFAPNSFISHDIELIAGTNTGGSGFVGGLVSQGANKVGDPISDIMVMVTDMNGNPVAYAYSDNQGAFTIPDLAYGDYILYPEVVGKTTAGANFSLSSSVNDITNFRVSVNSTTVSVSIATAVTELNSFAKLRIYPNPVGDVLFIEFGETVSNETQIQIYDVMGRLIQTEVSSESNRISIPTNSLKSGIYFVKISTSTEEKIMRFSK